MALVRYFFFSFCFLYLSVYKIFAMEGVKLEVRFDKEADTAALTDIVKYCIPTVRIEDPSTVENIELLTEDVVLRAKSHLLLDKAILGMANMELINYAPKERYSYARKVVALAIKYGAPIDRQVQGMTALWQAVKHDDYELAEFLTHNRAVPADPNVCTIPVFFLARSCKMAQLLRPLCDYTKKGLQGETILHEVMKLQYPATFAANYCAMGACPKAVDSKKETPLTWLMRQTPETNEALQTACAKMKILLTALQEPEVKRDYIIAALVAAKIKIPHGSRLISALEKEFNQLAACLGKSDNNPSQ